MDHPTPGPFLGSLIPFEKTKFGNGSNKKEAISNEFEHLFTTSFFIFVCSFFAFLFHFFARLKNGERIQTLIKSASQARQNAYVPYSKFSVGAALLCKDGEIIQGCNVENTSYGLSVCAEQTAIVKAISSGKNSFSAIAVVGDSDSSITTPCGRCRQFIFEFGNNIDIYCAKVDMKEILLTNINGLLPYGFNL